MVQPYRPSIPDAVSDFADDRRAPQFVAFEFDGSLFAYTYQGPSFRPLDPLFESAICTAYGQGLILTF